MSATSMDTGTHRVPFFLPGQAMQSLRDAGYSLPAALAEVVDNSLEASANNIAIRLDETVVNRKKRIGRIVIADDGDGMPYDILARYLQIGFSTRYMSTTTIGKYGVGAKLAALNFCTRVDVWSRTGSSEPWQHVALDLDAIHEQESRGEQPGIDPPQATEVPSDLAPMLPDGSGALVVWSNVDRLAEGAYAANSNDLRVEVEAELSRMFRYFLHGGIRILVNGTNLLPHDPVFLMDRTWADQVLHDHYTRLASTADQAPRYWADQEVPDHFPAEILAKDEKITVGGTTATLTVTVYPRAVVRERGKGGDELARRLRVSENQGCLSFVRLNREINYSPVARIFPRGVEDPDRFIGIEVRFTPDLDAFFGVRNVKKGVEPQDDLRKQIRERLKKYIPQARQRLDEMWGQNAQKASTHRGEHSPVMRAVKEASRTLPKTIGSDNEDPDQVLEDLTRDVLGPEAGPEDMQQYKESVKDLPVILESVDFPGNSFIDVKHLGHQVVVRLNIRHKFYRQLWLPLRELSEMSADEVSPTQAIAASRQAVEALTVLVTAYARAEGMNPSPSEAYGELRNHWGWYLETLLTKVKDILSA
ncbi:MAG TPA: ATP-binding protein [Acidobacteriaceae bacterium]|nr:ATP-binding protein [Acidobacteriaceae bacterium]